MAGGDYFIEVFRDGQGAGTDGQRLGSGLRISREFALTAAHCLAERELDGAALVRIHVAGGVRPMGEVVEYDRLSDLALLRLSFPKDEDVELPDVRFDDARRNERWRMTLRLSPAFPVLRGSIAEVSCRYGSTRRGAEVSAVRLTCPGGPDDCTPYAGSPVARDDDDWRRHTILGLIVERRPRGSAAPDTLYAGTVREAVRRFDRFRFRVEESASGPGADPAVAGSVRPYGVEAADAEEELRVEAAVDAALDRAGFTSVVRVLWIRR
ncbi:hypothetical protein [Streptomyces sp. PA5.6]|uniref:hypothetical protein n=1 Tax=Streptomyces sp. PA5.6 TaxID=3035651 RepID=UPI00390484E6